ncbi:unnamed protein product [Peronospora destructor]|nr:unnamed protein product [Peronospora destructor]
MTVICLWEYSEEHVAREICLPPMLEVYIARTLAPVADEVKENDTDRCGFYFIPYVALRQWIAQFQGFFVNSFDIQWDPQAEFLGPFPYAKVIQHFQ